MGSADAGDRILRFGRTERLAHWWLAATTAAMTATGASLYFPALAQLVDRPSAKLLHLVAAIALPVGLALLAIAGDGRALGRLLGEADRFDRDDLRWLRGGPRRLLDHDDAPPQGRLNAGQKLNTALTLGLLAVLAGTGTLLWLGERDTAWRFAGSVHVHDIATLLLAALVTGHLYLALIHPQTSAALSGMTEGTVDRRWAARHHAKWVERAASGAAAEEAPQAGAAPVDEHLAER